MGAFCEKTGRPHPPPPYGQFDACCEDCSKPLICVLSSDDEAPVANPSQSVPPRPRPTATPANTRQPSHTAAPRRPRPSARGSAGIVSITQAQITALRHQQTAPSGPSSGNSVQQTTSVATELYSGTCQVSMRGNYKRRTYLEVGVIKRILPFQIPLDQEFPNHQALISYLIARFDKPKVLFFPLPGRKLALYPNVRIRASLMSGSKGRNFRGQKKSGSRLWDHVIRLLPPNPCTKTTSTLRSPEGRWTTFSPRGSFAEDSDPRMPDSESRKELHVPRWVTADGADAVVSWRLRDPEVLLMELAPGEGSRDLELVPEGSGDKDDTLFRARASSSSSVDFLRNVNCLLNLT